MAYLALYDGTTTHNILDGSDYQLSLGGWWPKVPRLNKNLFGGVPDCEPVTENIKLWVCGTSKADLLSNLTTLSGVIDQANRWYAGDNVDPVLLRMSSETDSADYQAVIERGDNSDLLQAISKHSIFNDVGHFQSKAEYKTQVSITIVRRGLPVRVETEEQISSSSGLSAANVKQIISFGSWASSALDSAVLNPLEIELETRNAGELGDQSDGYLAVCSGSDDIEVFSPNDGSINNFTGHWDLVTEATAYDGKILRAKNTTATSFIAQFNRPSNADQRYHVFCKWRNPSTTISYTGRLYQTSFSRTSNSLRAGIELARFYCPTSTTEPQISYLGVMNFLDTKAAIAFTPSATTGVSNGIEIESILIISDETGSNIAKLENFGLEYEDNLGIISDGYQTITIKNNYVSDNYPSIVFTHDGTYEGVNPDVIGDLFFSIRGDSPRAILYATGQAGSWCTGNGSDGTPNTTVELKIKRLRGRRLP